MITTFILVPLQKYPYAYSPLFQILKNIDIYRHGKFFDIDVTTHDQSQVTTLSKYGFSRFHFANIIREIHMRTARCSSLSECGIHQAQTLNSPSSQVNKTCAVLGAICRICANSHSVNCEYSCMMMAAVFTSSSVNFVLRASGSPFNFAIVLPSSTNSSHHDTSQNVREHYHHTFPSRFHKPDTQFYHKRNDV